MNDAYRAYRLLQEWDLRFGRGEPANEITDPTGRALYEEYLAALEAEEEEKKA